MEYRVRRVAGGFVYVALDAEENVVVQSKTYSKLHEAVDAAWDVAGPFEDALIYEGEGEWQASATT